MTTSHPRQTVSWLTRRFREVGLQPNKRHGQNFLIDYNLIELLARTADVGPRDVVLEIGTGTGSLTALVAPHAARVITVEIDEHLAQIAREELDRLANVTILRMDALKNKNRFQPALLEAVDEALSQVEGGRLKLAANLPYNIATPVISNLLRAPHVPHTMTVTIQKELADRIMAMPSTKDYGALSVWVQSLCEVSLVRVLAPSVFWPRPKVDSAILHLVHREDWRAAIPDTGFLHGFCRAMFLHRRKFLRASAVSAFSGVLEKADVDKVLQQADIAPTARMEQLSVSEIQALSEAFRRHIADSGGSNAGWHGS